MKRKKKATKKNLKMMEKKIPQDKIENSLPTAATKAVVQNKNPG